MARTGRIAARAAGIVLIAFAIWLGAAAWIYSPEYAYRLVAWRESDVGDYLQNFPSRPLSASSNPFRFRAAPDQTIAEALFAQAVGAESLDTFLTRTQTQSLIAIKNDQVVLERYANGWQRESMNTSFSVAKSFVSTLVGMAIDEGLIKGLDDRITSYLPELAQRDDRFNEISIRHLLWMSSGLAYDETGWLLFNGDDPLTTYHPNQRTLALTNTRIEGPPGQTFKYNKYHPQLLGMILERTTNMSVTAWTQSRLWDSLGMEFDGAWTLDSEASAFEKMEAGLNARAIDFAKLGRLYLHQGSWSGRQLLSPGWVALATGVRPADRAPGREGQPRYYGLMWWGVDQDRPRPDFFAAGDHGQFIYISPANDVIIVRMGIEYGVTSSQWIDAFSAVADRL
jgi:CubicO group peptidase (beta-lactamase class C family)